MKPNIFVVFSPATRNSGGVKNVAIGMNSTYGTEYMNSMHAERNAIYKLNKIKYRNNIKRINLIVIRINRNGILGESRPCEDCLKMLQISGFIIKHIYYSTKNGTIIRETFSNMLYNSKTRRSKGSIYGK
jgi:cytidine deaminase